MSLYPRTCRLTHPREFQRVFERGLHRRFSVQGLLARVRENEVAQARLGFALSKRSLKRAVDRNRIKRLVRESFRLHRHSLPAVDIVVLAQADIAQLDNAVILQQLTLLWQDLRKKYANRIAKS